MRYMMKYAREKKNLNQDQLASLLNTTQQVISRIECGISTTLKRATNICNVLDITLDDFMKGV